MQSEMIDALLYWMEERQRIYLRKQAGESQPWTDDEILATYRFCNVYREQDRVTQWIREYWREGAFKGHPYIGFAMVVARLFNEPETLAAIEPLVLPFKPLALARALHKRARAGERVFNPAYIVSTNGVSMNKVDYLMGRVLAPMWKDRERLRPGRRESLSDYATLLRTYDGIAGFMAGQIVADLKYVHPLREAKDWWDFAMSGPGSRRGMNRVFGRDVEKGWSEPVWHSRLMELKDRVNERLPDWMEPVHGQDLQNCLCEFDKYRRAQQGGKPKQLYKENIDARQ